MNQKKLPLADDLAIERTRLANQRTLLAFIRTSMYFILAGITIVSLLDFSREWWVAIAFWIIAAIILAAGITRYRKVEKKLSFAGSSEKYWKVLVQEEE